ncbi:MAG: hypothetical protein ABJ275_01400 [Maricaulaceae bacterium]
MKLSPSEVQNRYLSSNLKVALLGMSNIGKSNFAARLARDFDFQSVEVDQLIQSKLGQGSMDDHAKWLGQPYSEGYSARETKAMELEGSAIQDAMTLCQTSGNAVLDAPGSVIYANDNILDQLKSDFWLIYIEASSFDLERLKQLYMSCPKPLIWKDSYDSSLGNTQDEAILNSYPKLLSQRSKIYKRLADITLPAEPLFSGKFDIKTALSL